MSLFKLSDLEAKFYCRKSREREGKISIEHTARAESEAECVRRRRDFFKLNVERLSKQTRTLSEQLQDALSTNCAPNVAERRIRQKGKDISYIDIKNRQISHRAPRVSAGYEIGDVVGIQIYVFCAFAEYSKFERC